MTALAAFSFLPSAYMKLTSDPKVVEGMTKFGWPLGVVFNLGIVELTCVILYLIPRTSVLGAILLTGYLGGAIATHVRVGDAFIVPIIIGVFVWGALWLRCARVRALIPIKS